MYGRNAFFFSFTPRFVAFFFCERETITTPVLRTQMFDVHACNFYVKVIVGNLYMRDKVEESCVGYLRVGCIAKPS